VDGIFCLVFVLFEFGNELDLEQRLAQIKALCAIKPDTMLKILLLVFLTSISKVSLGQHSTRLVGTWKLQYSLQPNKDTCNLPKVKDILILSSNNTYSWQTGRDIIKGKWKINNGTLQLFNNKAINFSGTVADLSYPMELKNEILNIHEPEGGDISCPNLFYKKVK